MRELRGGIVLAHVGVVDSGGRERGWWGSRNKPRREDVGAPMVFGSISHLPADITRP